MFNIYKFWDWIERAKIVWINGIQLIVNNTKMDKTFNCVFVYVLMDHTIENAGEFISFSILEFVFENSNAWTMRNNLNEPILL